MPASAGMTPVDSVSLPRNVIPAEAEPSSPGNQGAGEVEVVPMSQPPVRLSQTGNSTLPELAVRQARP